MCCSTTRNEPYHPRWLNEVGGKELIAEYRGTAFPIADFDDPITLQRHLDFIKRLGERYDGHPDIAHVDIGSIGWWGEWHLSALPEEQDAVSGEPNQGGRCLSRRLQEDAAVDADRGRSVPQVRHRAWFGLACRLPR